MRRAKSTDKRVVIRNFNLFLLIFGLIFFIAGTSMLVYWVGKAIHDGGMYSGTDSGGTKSFTPLIYAIPELVLFWSLFIASGAGLMSWTAILRFVIDSERLRFLQHSWAKVI